MRVSKQSTQADLKYRVSVVPSKVLNTIVSGLKKLLDYGTKKKRTTKLYSPVRIDQAPPS